jgi:hypothetical protein
MNITLEINDMVLDIDYDYQPKEEATLEYPGCNEDVCINGAFVNGVDVFKSLSESIKNKISDCIWELIYE